MKKIRQLDLTNHVIWNNKNIKPEAKEIYSYLYCRGFDRTVFHFNIGDIQKYIPITNVGFRNNLKILEKLKLLIYKEYKNVKDFILRIDISAFYLDVCSGTNGFVGA